MRRAPAFWWRDRPSLQALALSPVAQLWGWRACRRLARAPAYWSAAPVICVGNYTVGGSGKTPTALAVGAIAEAEGLKPGYLIRGYGGSERGPLLVNPAIHGPERVGDEALLLAKRGLTVVCGDRPAGARLLVKAGATIIIMDDGFQNPALGKDLSLIVVEAGTGIGNGRLGPAGPLRAPLEPQLARTGALVVAGSGDAARPLVRLAARAGRPVLEAKPVPADAAGWAGRRVLAFAGIGRPEKFFRSLEAAGVEVGAWRAFPDHHVYRDRDAAGLLAAAEEAGLALVTTEKDLVRLGPRGAVGRLREAVREFPIRLQFDNPGAVRGLIVDAAARATQRRAGVSAPRQ